MSSEESTSRPWIGARAILAVMIAISLASVVEGRVVRLVVERREAVVGGARGYERLTGRFHGELDPAGPRNRIINDIGLAPRNGRGRVEYVATFTILRPAEGERGSGVLWYEVPNRGNSPLAFRLPSDSMAVGDILVSSGWQGDLEPRPGLETITVPTASNGDGSSITGPVLIRLSDLPGGSSTALLTGGYAGLRYQRPETLATSAARLTRQYSDDGQIIPIDSREWVFGDCRNSPFPGRPDPTSICLKGGFEAGALYQLVYTAKDPLVLGIGLAATRDLVSFLRHAEKDDVGTPNPTRGLVRYLFAEGTSQSGNYLKTFIHLGFNQDEDNRQVFDGVNPNIAARLNPLNFRFAIPGGATGLYEPGSEGVLWWSGYRDEPRGRGIAGLLDRCRATKSCPKIFETFGSAEFWGLRMSPGLTGTRADVDIQLPPEVRRYYFPGVTHGGGRGGFELTGNAAPGCVLTQNPNSSGEAMRALRRALVDWVVKGIEPPASRYPRLSTGELVRPIAAEMGFPIIPGRPLPDNMINRFPDYDLGPGFRYGDLSGVISIEPPPIRGIIPMVVPRTDRDGNEVGGIASVLHLVPLGSYLGWNVTAAGYYKGRGCGFAGGFIPFSATKAEREASGDPRPSLEERYGSHESYVARVREAAARLVKERFLLPDDAARIVNEAEASSILR